MSKVRKIKEAQKVLQDLGLPRAQQNEMAALTLLALSGVKPRDEWRQASRQSMTVTKDIMFFVKKEYGKTYAPNTRETFRRQVLHQFIEAGLVMYNPDEPSLPVNSPKAHYALTPEALDALRLFGTRSWNKAAASFRRASSSITTTHRRARRGRSVTLSLGGKTLKLSPGKHNVVQAAVVTEFLKRFAPAGQVIYLGDTQTKNLFVDREPLMKLRIPIDKHSKLPDVIIYDLKRDWLFLIEAVTSHGPVTPTRVLQLEKLLTKCRSGRIYVSAFPDKAEFRKHVANIAWETEVWFVDDPAHMIHFNGEKFLGPYATSK